MAEGLDLDRVESASHGDEQARALGAQGEDAMLLRQLGRNARERRLDRLLDQRSG
jgi:nitric oxide reductase activation protein